MAKRLAVVVAQSPSRNPAKRKLEEDIITGLLFEPGIDVTVVPNLYDIKPDSTGMMALQGIGGNMVVCSWLFERAAHWVLDRNGICGHVGPILLQNEDEEEDEEFEEENEADDAAADDKFRVVDNRDIPNRKIYCLDLKTTNRAQEFIDEVKRIQEANLVKLVTLGDLISSEPAPKLANGGPAVSNSPRMNSPNVSNSPSVSAGPSVSAVPPSNRPDLSAAQARFDVPTNDTALPTASELGELKSSLGDSQVQRIEESNGRRWYPVIDYSRCTNCMECIDFCLFGVYGVDRIDTILVEQPDNCRKGCPACSRVCPENAIMFPQHKTPAIAGSAEGNASMKIDLSQLFGAPADGKSAAEIAALERDEQLIAAGRDAVGMSVGIPKRHSDKSIEPKDELDNLIDQLDELDL